MRQGLQKKTSIFMNQFDQQTYTTVLKETRTYRYESLPSDGLVEPTNLAKTAYT